MSLTSFPKLRSPLALAFLLVTTFTSLASAQETAEEGGPPAAAAAADESAATAAAPAVKKWTPPAPGTAQAAVASGLSILENGDFEAANGKDTWPAKWGKVKSGGSYEEEDGNHFIRLTQETPGEFTMLYHSVPLPPEVKALTLTYRQRLKAVRPGAMMWFDARVIMEFKDASGKKMPPPPPAPNGKGTTKGWVEKRISFLVPEGAKTLEFMPALFQVKSGTFDFDDMALVPTDPQPIIEQREARKAEKKSAEVVAEAPAKDKWPLELHVDGNRLKDTNGKEVWLQGISTSGWETTPADPFVTKAAMVGVDDWRANIVRVPLKEIFWFGTSGMEEDGGAAYRKRVDDLVTLVANRGAYVLLDLHRYRAPRAEHVEFWKAVAAHYKDHPAVLFDLFNEPHDTTWEVWRNGGEVAIKGQGAVDEGAFLSEEEKKARDQGFQSVGMQALVDAVRSTGAKNIVVAGGLAFANDLSGVLKGFALDDKGGNGVVYSWHCYNWHKGWQKHMLDIAEKHPILVGELGAEETKFDFVPAELQEAPATWVPDMLGMIQKHRLNWTGWCMHPSSSPRMLVDWTFKPTPYWGVHVKDALGGKQFEMKKMR